jgi:hypothetical protein
MRCDGHGVTYPGACPTDYEIAEMISADASELLSAVIEVNPKFHKFYQMYNLYAS